LNRRRYIAANWKMNHHRSAAAGYLTALRERVPRDPGFDVAIFPPFPYLELAVTLCAGTPIAIGAQNCHFEPKGAFTGEVAATMVRDVGASRVLVGHSERRHLFHETDAEIAKKVAAALGAGLDPILCVGETLDERKGGETEAVVLRHLTEGLSRVAAADLGRVSIAYEPVWAIGTGLNATPEQAGEVHSFLRNRFAERFGRAAADAARILYGGSVTPENAKALLSTPGVDGVLVGGASLDIDKARVILDVASALA
jgi:triosephosphate isomerase